jgi:hypothetical protein
MQQVEILYYDHVILYEGNLLYTFTVEMSNRLILY